MTGRQDEPNRVRIHVNRLAGGRIGEAIKMCWSFAFTPNIAGPGLSVTRAFNVETKPIALPDVVRIDT
jgi:hypothetical protein